MFRKILPKVGRPVMVRVVAVDPDGSGGTVALVGYRHTPLGRIINDNDDDLEINRIEPAMLSSRDLLLLTNNVSFEDRVSCEKKFNKQKHTHTIMRLVARRTGFDLEKVYRILNWPSYKDLMDSQSDFWDFSQLIHVPVVEALHYAVNNITLHTLRITNPRVLSSSRLIQDRATCWACGQIRQFESHLKDDGQLPFEESLCIDDLVKKTVLEGQAHRDDGSIDCLSHAENTLLFMGIKSSKVDGHLYYLREFKVVFDHQYTPSRWNKLLVDMAKNLRGSIATSVIWFPSYNNNLQGQAIYKPTKKERRAY